MGSYIVHVYRRESRDDDLTSLQTYGVVEGIEHEQQIPFTNAEELWKIVTGGKSSCCATVKKLIKKPGEMKND